MIFDFFPQVGDMDAQKMRVSANVWPPNSSEQLTVSQNLPRLGNKETEQGIFGGGQSDFTALPADDARRQIDFQGTAAEHAF